MRNDGGMEFTHRLADYLVLTDKKPDPGELRLIEPLSDDLPALAGLMALPVGLSIFLWGCLLIAVFT